jgi:hypothetical protein
MATWLAVASILETRSTKPQSNRPAPIRFLRNQEFRSKICALKRLSCFLLRKLAA